MGTIDRFEALRSETDFYRLLINAIDDYAIYMLDPDGRVVSWNAGARRFKGYEAGEIIGQNFERFYTDADRATDLPLRALATARSDGRFENEGWRVRKDGTRFWAHVIIDRIMGDDGQLVGFAKVTRDLTERRAADEELRRSQEQFRLLVQGVTDYAIYMLDPNGNVSSWNTGAERIKGYSPDEIIGAHFSRFYTEEDRAAGQPAKALQRSLAEGRYEHEGWRVRKDGSRFWASVVIDPIRLPNGDLAGFAKITRDITESRDAQNALQAAREELLQAQKMEAIGQLTGGMAHDFNNLLTAILSSLELVRKHLPDDPRVTRLIDNAVHGAQRGATLTQRMLAYARRQSLKTEAVNVPALVESLAELIRPSLGAQTRMVTQFPDGLPPAVTDYGQLETALINLCVNSRDAMPDGGLIEITARAETLVSGNAQDLKPGDYLCLSVIDQGEGMDELTVARATEPFFTTKGVGKGSGLGLPMVHGLAAQSGGKLILRSRRAEGTTAELWLPADASAIPAVEMTPPGGLADASATDAERPLVVIAVDDDALVLMNTTMMLEELGHTVHEATNGHAALELLQSLEAVDLVISDHAMPGMTGSQLAHAIRDTWPHLPIILATGYAELPPGGANDLPRLSKPFSQNDLAKAVATAVPR